MTNRKDNSGLTKADRSTFEFEEIQGESNLVKVKTYREGKVFELEVFYLSEDEFRRLKPTDEVKV